MGRIILNAFVQQEKEKNIFFKIAIFIEIFKENLLYLTYNVRTNPNVTEMHFPKCINQ